MIRCLALVLLFAQPVQAQIRTHHEYIPAIGANSTLTAPDSTDNESFKVMPGQTVVITGRQTCRNIYVESTNERPAILELTDGCELRCQTILLFGHNAILRTPPGQNVRCKVVWRDLEFDLVNDPQQFSNGLVCVSGQVLLSGLNPRSCKADVTAELRAGTRTITLADTPLNWTAGDELWIPDTRQPGATANTSQTERVTIQSIQGNVITLAAPLAFDHLGWHRQDGSVGELFEIANVSQPIVFESENPNGVRGHAIFMDHCRIEVSGLTCREMGRTTVEPLHSTVWNPSTGVITQLGTNQIGRYPWHFHGMPGRPDAGEWQWTLRYFSIVGSPKLGLVLHHSSHFGLCEHFAIVDCAGGHLVTETANVYGNRFADGICMGRRPGSGQRLTSRAHRNANGGDHWHPTSGLALQSAMQEFEDVSVYSMQEGIGMAGFRGSTLLRPIARGQHTGDAFSRYLNEFIFPQGGFHYPFLPSSDVRVWGSVRGIETWTADCYHDTARMFPGMELIHCFAPTDFEDQQETYLDEWRLLGDFSQVVAPTNTKPPRTYGLNFKPGYRFGITMQAGEIRGYDAAYNLIHDREYTTFNGVEFECPAILYESLGYIANADCVVTLADCSFSEVGGTLVGINGWLPKYGLELWLGSPTPRPDRPTLNDIDIQIRPWVDGRDLDVYHHEQRPSWTLTPISESQGYGDWPLGVWSQQQLIDLDMPVYGSATPSTATQDVAHFGPRFWINDVTPEPPTLEERVERLEQAVFGNE